MIKNDLSHWPLVVTRMQDASSLDEHLLFFKTWTEWLDRGEPFATFRVFADMDALSRPEGGAKEAKVWLQSNADRIKQLVIGMATVIPEEAMEQHGKLDAEKLFGVPARTFSNADDAMIWIVSLMATRGHVVDAMRFGFLSDQQVLAHDAR